MQELNFVPNGINPCVGSLLVGTECNIMMVDGSTKLGSQQLIRLSMSFGNGSVGLRFIV